MNPKKINELSHTLAVLANVTIEVLDKLEASSEIALEFKQKAKELLPFCEKIVEDTYLSNQVKSTTYITDMSNKIITVIRKNYTPITS